MEVAASAWVFFKKHAGKIKGERATRFGVALSAARVVSATTSTLDWISDGNYARSRCSAGATTSTSRRPTRG